VIKQEIDTAMRAHTNLSIFAAVVTLLEDGLYGGSPAADDAAAKIIKIAKKAQQVQLRSMDTAVAAAIIKKGKL